MKKSTASLAPWVTCTAAAIAAACVLAGCGPDYASGISTTHAKPTPAPGASTATTPAADGGSSNPITTTWPDAGGAAHDGGGTASGSDAGGGGAAGFLGETAPYASAPVSTSARDHHVSAGQIQQQPTTDCMGCHGAGGVATAFVAGGFVATQPGGTNGASDIEVRVWSSAQSAGAGAHTDADGFFWILASGTVTAPFKAGARDATHQMVMPTAPPGGGCSGSSCHGGGQGAIHVP